MSCHQVRIISSLLSYTDPGSSTSTTNIMRVCCYGSALLKGMRYRGWQSVDDNRGCVHTTVYAYYGVYTLRCMHTTVCTHRCIPINIPIHTDDPDPMTPIP